MRFSEIIEKQPENKSNLYVSRRLLNFDEVTEWAAKQGFAKTIGRKMHATIAYSRVAVDWSKVLPLLDDLTIRGGDRQMDAFGDENDVAVLKFASEDFLKRWQEFLDIGCSWDYPDYSSHITITYDGTGIDISKIEPYYGLLVFGPEVFTPLKENWKEDNPETET